ncbi:MAG TPA: MFS transporter, partial [Anaerolineae bacterium]|nr:MFS transporter [Anaerolineae bacterium]
TFFPATLIFGIGLGITVAPLTTVALGSVPTHMSGLASGVSNAASRLASMLAVATLGALMVVQFSSSLERHTQSLPLSAEDRLLLQEEKLKLGGAEPPPGLPSDLHAKVATAIDEAFVDAFRLMMALCAVLALVSAAGSFVTITNEIIYHDKDHPSPHFEIMS